MPWRNSAKRMNKLLDLLFNGSPCCQGEQVDQSDGGIGEIFHPLSMTTQEAYTFLKEIQVYENAGILCRIPNWWKGPLKE